MIAAQRQQLILDALAKAPFLSIVQQARRLHISPATIRRDFDTLAAQGLARRVRGGLARLATPTPSTPSFAERRSILAAEKDRIGRAAAQLVRDGETIILDGGTTTSSMAPYLAPKRVTVITNSLTVADYLAEHGQADVFVLGGSLYRPSKVMLGTPAQHSLRQFIADKAFVSTGGLSLEGIGHSNSLIAETEKVIISRARYVVLLADHTKFTSGGAMKVCPWTKVSRVITDAPPPPHFLRFFKRRGIQLTIAR
ncbi:MAG: DeoR/GlpR family DNA-binding transcription regulator [bacterium]|nr:DeoR/GlpR family DNA-binding transcription regulator [bacterium]